VFYTGIGLPSATTNQGELVQPARDIQPLVFRTASGEPFTFGQPPFKWSLLIPANGGCADQCRQTLYFTRQLHKALGRLQPSLRRYLVVEGDPLPPETVAVLAGEYPALTLLHAGADESRAMFGGIVAAEGAAAAPSYYLVDPAGYLMMYYTSAHNHKQVLADLKFLIKESGEQ
jgi:cytochrome oxidase Cu insertion factor (SCO1/SenC/PrrC family)